MIQGFRGRMQSSCLRLWLLVWVAMAALAPGAAYSQSAQVNVEIVGQGRIKPNYNGVSLPVGASYSMTAIPAPGFVFSNWTLASPAAGVVITNSPAIQFTMVSNLTVTASFVDVQKPTDTITLPVSGQQVNNAVYTVTGRATDNAGVAGVWYQFNNGNWTLAGTTNHWTNWFATIAPAPGVNTLRTYAQDVSGRQNLYVGDRYNDLIRKITPAGLVTTLAGDTYDLTNSGWGPGSFVNAGYADGAGELAQFDNPNGTAVDAAGNIYVADSQNNLIRKITPAGVVTTLAGDLHDLTNNYYNPTSGGQPNAGLADGPGESAQFNYPTALALDRAGNLYVADTDNSLIRKITPEGMVSTVAGNPNAGTGYADGPAATAQFYMPFGIAVDGAGNVIVADTFNHLIRELTPDGLVRTLAGDTNDLVYQGDNDGYADGPGGAAQFAYPFGVTVDGSGNIYVGDVGNDLVRKITPDGLVTTLAGDIYDLTNGGYNPPIYNGQVNIGTNAGFADGTGAAAKFNEPCALAADASENLFVVDSGNNLIRKITPAGVTTTVAGNTNPPAAGYAEGAAGSAAFYIPPPSGVSVDESGANFSATNTVTFNYFPGAPLTVSISGKGTVAPDYNGALLQIGKTYAMTARPGPGFVFTNWTLLNISDFSLFDLNSMGQLVLVTNTTVVLPGAVITNRPTLSFVMAAPSVIFSNANASLTAETGYRANFADVQPPALRITSPAPNAMVTNASFLITGTASDNAAVASVQYQFNGGGWQTAAGTNQWSEAVGLNPGTNTIQAYAVDTSGNVSATNTVNFVLVSKAVLTVSINGNGTVTPNYSGVPLQIGQNYSMTARPGPGFAFTNWSCYEVGGQPDLRSGPSSGHRPKYWFNPLNPWGGNIGTDSPMQMPIFAVGTAFYQTNQPTLLFRMEPNLYLFANFNDIAPPTLNITSPTPKQYLSNAVYTVTGTARDNVAVAAVYYQLNGTGWFSASTGNGWTNWFTPSLVLQSSATNVIQAYAVDTSGNVSATNTVRFVNLHEDSAPDSIAGTVASLVWTPLGAEPGDEVIAYGFATLGFSTNTFDQTPTIPGTPFSVGNYWYTKYSSDQAQLIYSNTAPQAALGAPVVLDLTFSSPGACTYSNETTGVNGTISFVRATNLAPAAVTGATALLIETNGLETTAVFGGGTVTFTNVSGLNESAVCTYQSAGVNAGLLAFSGADQTANYVFFRYDSTNAGLFYYSSYDAGGNLLTNVFGEFVFPSVPPAAPAALDGTSARVSFGGGIVWELSFDHGTYGCQELGSGQINYSMGAYNYTRTSSTNVLLTLTPAFPPGTNETFHWTFVAPDFCLFTNAGAADGTVAVAAFTPTARLAPLSLGSETLYATNTAVIPLFAGPAEDITCHGGAFTQFAPSGAYAGTSHGSFTYAAYGSSLALLTLTYTSPASLAGATNYLEASFTFDNATNGFINALFYDKAGDPPVFSQGEFYLH
jgi:sugar lactone lactonase YvrE